MTYQLIKDGQVLAEHSTRLACVTEALERRIVNRTSAGCYLQNGVSIIEVKEGEKDAK